MQTMDDPLDKLYSRWGDEPFQKLVGAFYRRVRADDLLGPMYPPEDWAAAEQRLRDFLIQRCGGPGAYTAARGHPRLRARHMPFAIDQAARDRWIQRMDEAAAETQPPPEGWAILRPFLNQVATFMINRQPQS